MYRRLCINEVNLNYPGCLFLYFENTDLRLSLRHDWLQKRKIPFSELKEGKSILVVGKTGNKDDDLYGFSKIKSLVILNPIITDLGEFFEDSFGINHYKQTSFGIVDASAKDALKYKPKTVCFFWFNGTFCPMKKEDTVGELTSRWIEWRHSHQEGKGQDIANHFLLDKVLAY